MLQQLPIHATIPVSDLERAKKFYSEKLGLNGEETPAGIMYTCSDGTWFLLFVSGGAGKSSSTSAGWQTDDLESEVKDLQSRGLVFEEYDLPNLKTENGIANSPVGKAAWFKDSEGNTLGIVQFDK